jgi:HK97 family phage major capsid protein
MSKTLSDLQIAKRDEIIAQGRDAIAAAEAEGRDLTDDEAAIVRDAAERSADITANIEATAAVVRDLSDLAPAPRAIGGAVVRSEPLTYMKQGGKHSHVRDMAVVSLNLPGRQSAQERLDRHAQEVAVEMRAGDTGDTAGGTFVPPLWVLSEYVGVQRAGRATADLARQMALPSGTDAISIPTITTGTLEAVQATENSAATTRDMVTASTTAEVTTIAGIYDFSIQLLEQSALSGGWDALVYNDLLADYNRALDTQVLSGTGANNQVPGVHTVAGTTVFASSTSSTTAQNQIFGGLGDALSRVASTRFAAPEVIVMHPRRWFWLVTRYDTAGRPLVTPDAQAANAMLATFGLPTGVQGAVGTMLGLPVVIDANVSTSAGTSEDRILVWKASDALLFEGTPTFEVFRTTGGTTDTLTARARLYNYAAFTTRYTTGAALVGGTALSSPTF